MSERIDDLQIGGYRLIQNPELFCFGVDAVLLSSFARVDENERAIDLGTGNGVIPILLEAKNAGRDYVGLELQEASYELAKRNVELNLLEGKVSIVHGDIKEAAELFGASSFEVVTTNPPYIDENHGIKNEYAPKAIARHEILCTLEDLIAQSSRLLKPNGRFYMIHKPHRLTQIMVLMREYHIEPKRLRMVQPYAEKEPTMVLIEGLRGGKPFLKVDSPLVIYQSVNEYTDEIRRIYGHTGP